MVKNLPAMQKMQVPSQGWEDPLEKEMATHSSILAWEIPWRYRTGDFLPDTGFMVSVDNCDQWKLKDHRLHLKIYGRKRVS